MRKILVASTNPGKLKELRELLGGDIEWVSLSDFKDVPEIEEDGKTFVENARKKAIGYAKATGLWTLADDSGLVVDALDGQPGVKSARFSGTKDANRGLIDHKNMAKVLKLLEGVPKEKWTARFMCCLCLATPEKVLVETSGKLEGLIIDTPAGENGFGYDPIFFVPESNKTVAQMTSVEKNAISHRGNAIRKFKPQLEELISK